MSQIVYFVQRRITFSEFANVLAIPSLDVELDDGRPDTKCGFGLISIEKDRWLSTLLRRKR